MDGRRLALGFVYDLLGRRVARVDVEPTTPELLVPGTSALAPGVYLVRLRARLSESHAKVFVVR